MENQISAGKPDTPQVGQNPIGPPAEITGKPRINRWITLAVLLLVSLTIVSLGWFFAYKPVGEGSSQKQDTTNTPKQTPEAPKNLNQENLPLDVSVVWTLEREWLESGYTPQQLEQGGIKLEREWLTVFVPPGAAPVNSIIAFMLVPEPTDEDLSNIWLDSTFQISGSSDDKRNQLKDLQFNLVIYQPLDVNHPRLALLHKETLNYYFWDSDKFEWVPVPSLINLEKGYALAKYNKFGTYSLRGNPINKAPKIFSVEPNTIKYNQDVVITIRGENFQKDFFAVNFGIGSYAYEFIDSSTLRVRMKKEGNNFLISPGTYELVIRNPDGQGAHFSEALKVEE